MAAGWAVVLVAWAIAVASASVRFIAELTSTLLVMGFLGGTLWVAGSISQSMGWIGLRAARGGHARGVAVLELGLGAAYLLVPLLGFWGLPFMWIPAYLGLCAWHGVAAAWFIARRDGRAARVAAIGHGGAAGGLFLTFVCGEADLPGLVAVTLALAAVGALVGHLATGRYMAATRPWLEVVETFE
ncbi:MAG: hypothetical protein U1F43_03045 [Myxococcota bacterium]